MLFHLIDGILPKGPYPPCLSMADRALLAGYPWKKISKRMFTAFWFWEGWIDDSLCRIRQHKHCQCNCKAQSISSASCPSPAVWLLFTQLVISTLYPPGVSQSGPDTRLWNKHCDTAVTAFIKWLMREIRAWIHHIHVKLGYVITHLCPT